MKKMIFLLLATLVLLVPLANPGPARAASTRTDFTAQETSCPEDTMILLREWMAGITYHNRLTSSSCNVASDNPQVSGVNNLSNGVLNAGGTNDAFTVIGKWRLVTEEGGSWNGTFFWAAGTWILKAVGQGEGIYAGQRIHMFEDESDGTIWGYIEFNK